MNRFFGIVFYEYFMSIRRWGIWIIFGLVFGVYFFTLVAGPSGMANLQDDAGLWLYIAQMTYKFNILLPAVAAIAHADRLVRDLKIGTIELLQSAPLDRRAYILGKYLGSLCSALTPALIAIFILDLHSVWMGASWKVFPISLLVFLLVAVPTYVFVIAFSLALPAIMPARVYQILFVGYWMWGNYLNPKDYPTINGTFLTASGRFVIEGFLRMPAFNGFGEELQTTGFAFLNLFTLAFCSVLVLFALERFLARRAG